MAKKEVKKTTKNSGASKAKKAQTVDVAKVQENVQIVAEGAGHGHNIVGNILLPPKVAVQIAEEVAKLVGGTVMRPVHRRNKRQESQKKYENALFLDTSAIIDGRVFELVKIGAFFGNAVIIEGVLSELKNIADSKDDVKRERGRRALRMLDDVKRERGIKIHILADKQQKGVAVDDRLITLAKKHKGRIVTADFNLSKKAKISGVISIDLYEMANILKTTAVPGEEFFIKVIQKGKGEAQGVGYLPDGTMIVVEQGELLLGKTVKVLVSRIIQTDAGKIFFAKVKGAESS